MDITGQEDLPPLRGDLRGMHDAYRFIASIGGKIEAAIA